MGVKKVVYIAGYGRSGSTLIERILGSNDSFFGVGELTNVFLLLNSGTSMCSCGKRLDSCYFWSGLKAVLESMEIGMGDNMNRIQYRNEALCGFLRCSLGFNFHRNTYYDLVEAIFGYISHACGDGVEYIIDSSKTARQSFCRPIQLKRMGFDVKVVHIVRDGRGCLWSNIKGSNRNMEKGEEAKIPFTNIRTAITWPLANLAAHLFQFHYKNDYLRIRYEDLVDNPIGVISEIELFLKVNLSEQKEMVKGEVIPLGHQLSGNRLRSISRLHLRKDVAWKKRLQMHHKCLFVLFCWPLLLKYNYLIEKNEVENAVNKNI